MVRERTQLNIKIDPDLLLKLKSEAIKNGKTLTEFVIQQLKDLPDKNYDDQLEKRRLRIEKLLAIDKEAPVKGKQIGTIFSNEGAKEYGETARMEFLAYAKRSNLTIHAALEELDGHLSNYPHANNELIYQILLDTHHLTGLEMTIAYRHGSCAMRSALNDLTNDPLEKLNKAFLNAVITKSLV